eukprot:SAG11_NODE_28665_length_319_cov_0.709091_1_plen_93_part_10
MSESLPTAAAEEDAASAGHHDSGAVAVASGLLQRPGRAEPERTRRVIYFLTVVWFVPLIMWFPAYTQYVLARRCSALMATGEASSCSSSVVSA